MEKMIELPNTAFEDEEFVENQMTESYITKIDSLQCPNYQGANWFKSENIDDSVVGKAIDIVQEEINIIIKQKIEELTISTAMLVNEKYGIVKKQYIEECILSLANRFDINYQELSLCSEQSVQKVKK